MERSLGVPNAADPAVLDRFAADSRRSAADVNQVRSRLAGARISPRADRFGLVSDLIGQHDDAKRQVVDALDSVAEGFEAAQRGSIHRRGVLVGTSSQGGVRCRRRSGSHRR
jgi:hypothetical protein